MAFKVIKIEMTNDQIKLIEKATMNGKRFSLLAEPHLDTGMLRVQIVTDEQFKILRTAILKAYKLPQWKNQ